MGSFLHAVRSSMVAQAVLSIALGVLLVVWPGITVVTIVYLLALYLAVTGVVSLVGYARARDGRSGRSGSTGSLVGGVLLLALALFVFVFPQVVAGFFSLVLGLLLVVGGAVNAARAIELRRYRGGTWTIALVAGIVVALGGVVIVVNPFETTVTYVLVLGVLLVLKGAADLLVSLWLTSAMKQLQ